MQASKNYNTLIDFAKFLRENGDKFEKDSKLCLNCEQLLVLQDYLMQITSKDSGAGAQTSDRQRRSKEFIHNKEFLVLYKSNQLYIIHDFMQKIMHLKISAEVSFNKTKDFVHLSVFGNLTYLEIKNCPISNIYDLQSLRSHLEVLICVKSVNKVQDLFHSCGADASSPISWPKLRTVNLSHNQLTTLDTSFRLTSLIEILDLSHNNLKSCDDFLHTLTKLTKLNLSFNKLTALPSLTPSKNASGLEYLDVSYNYIDTIDSESMTNLESLKHLNLTNNLINSLQQLQNFRLLSLVEKISIEGNPIKYNPNCDTHMQDILAAFRSRIVGKGNRSFTTESSWKPSGSPSNEDTTKSRAGLPIVASTSVSTGLSGLERRQNVVMRRKLKPTNVLIDSKRAEDANTDEDAAYSASESFMSKSYDARKLQQELESMKQDRKNYGHDWLISTPGLKSYLGVMHEAELARSVTDESVTEETASLSTSPPPRSPMKRESMDLMLESFAVYRTTEYLSADNNEDTSEQKLCFLSLNDKYIVERDETNTKIMDVHEITHLIAATFTFKSRDKKTENKIKLTFKDQIAVRVYQFENEEELHSFIKCMRKLLFNEINLRSCEMFYCIWCDKFNEKSKFKVEDDVENIEDSSVDEFANLTCTTCHRYLMKDGVIVEKTDEVQGSVSLKDVLKSFKVDETPKDQPADEVSNETSQVDLDAEKAEAFDAIDANGNIATPNESLASEQTNDASVLNGAKLQLLLANNQLTKAKLDEKTSESKRINNNLKLYLIMNVLSDTLDDKTAKTQSQSISESESLICTFRLAYFYHYSETCSPDNKQPKIELSTVTNCLCIITNHKIAVLRILNTTQFEEGVEFESCLRKEFIIELNRIEVIEMALGQHYLFIENPVDFADTADKGRVNMHTFKFVTLDIYETQAFLNTLQKTINESNNSPCLKHIRKKNELTNQNLAAIMNTHFKLDNEMDFMSGLFFFMNSLEINTEVLISVDGQPHLSSSVESITSCIYLHNKERLVLLDENLSYFHNQPDTTKNKPQFALVDSAKVADIVQLRIFDEFETRAEISFVDESKNSTQVVWIVDVNKPFQLSQLVGQLKNIWEEIFHVDFPVNYQ